MVPACPVPAGAPAAVIDWARSCFPRATSTVAAPESGAAAPARTRTVDRAEHAARVAVAAAPRAGAAGVGAAGRGAGELQQRSAGGAARRGDVLPLRGGGAGVVACALPRAAAR